jgi:hypothetical protein
MIGTAKWLLDPNLTKAVKTDPFLDRAAFTAVCHIAARESRATTVVSPSIVGQANTQSVGRL